MKRILAIALLLCSILSTKAWITYEIAGKGNTGQYKCSGKIVEDPWGYRPNSIQIILSEMLEATFNIASKEQIDQRTIKYICYKVDSTYNLDKYIIIKYKCPYGKDVYFFTFPALYNGDKDTTYKTIIKGINQ